jgi:DNA-binding NarL/FixJ family response regulator
MGKISVIIVDDHQLFREGLKLLLNNLSVIGRIEEAANGAELLSVLENQFLPDIIFMDIEMPGINGIETTKQALKLVPGLNIIALSMYGDEDYYSNMIEAGAKGFILKNSGILEVELAIKHVLDGNNYFSQEILSGLLKNINKKKRILPSPGLTEREEEVLFQICRGLSNQEIAGVLNISKRTVDKHRENLLLKTESKNTAGLVIYAIKNGIVEV